MSDPISDALLDSLRAYDSNNHLPECQAVCVAPDETPDECTICAAVRACEQRIREWYNQPSMYDEGYYNGVRDSFDAVERVRDRYPAPNGVIFASHALAAIDALTTSDGATTHGTIRAPHVDPCDCDYCKGKP